MKSQLSDKDKSGSTQVQRKILEVKDLRTYFFLDQGVLKAVDGVTLYLNQGEAVGIIGESGCGKSVTGLSLLGLVQPPGLVVAGEIKLERKDGEIVSLLGGSDAKKAMLNIRGSDIGFIFQEPMTSFSPVHTVGSQIAEMLMLHTEKTRQEAQERVIDLLDQVGIANPAQRYKEYPHQLSGGMRQRAMIAMAISCDPKIVIADEPTTALDVTLQAQILELLKRLQEEKGIATIHITHNMAVISESVERVYVMYLGRIVETTTTDKLFAKPLHPYTEGLLKSIPQLGRNIRRLESIKGSVPTALNMPIQCGFYPRCTKRIEGVCNRSIPALVETEQGHSVRCFLHSSEEEPMNEFSDL